MTQTYKNAEVEQVFDPGLFRALADPNRVILLAHLGERGDALTVTEAAACCPVDVSVVSRHLGVLRDAGVVSARKAGREVHYRVEHAALAKRLRQAADAIERCCTDTCCPEGDER